MKHLVKCSGETVNLGILEAGEVIVINAGQSPQTVRMASKIGNRRYLHATALGKILLAGLPDKEASRLMLLRGLPQSHSPHRSHALGFTRRDWASAETGVRH